VGGCAAVVAMIGDVALADGKVAVIPVGAELLGKASQVNARLLPDTVRLSWALKSWTRVMAPPVAVKGPIVPAEEGRVRVTPPGGMGDGRGTSMVMVPVEICAGVAPVASTLAVAEPVRALLPNASAAPAMLAGSESVV